MDTTKNRYLVIAAVIALIAGVLLGRHNQSSWSPAAPQDPSASVVPVIPNVKFTPNQQGPVFTYQQGGTAQPNVFTTWAAAYAAAAAVQYLDPTIVIDASLGTPVVTTGTYDIHNMTIMGNSGFPTLNINDGAHFTGAAYNFIGPLFVNNKSTTAPCVSTSTFVTIYMSNGANIQSDATATQAMFSVTGGGIFIDMGADGAFTGIAAAPIITASGGSNTVIAGRYSVINANSLAGATAIAVQLSDSSATLSSPQGAAVAATQGPSNAKPAISLSAVGGAQGIPARATTVLAPTPSWFLATPSGNQASATTYTLPVGGAYKPLDIIHVLFNKAQIGGFVSVTVVDGGSGTPTLGAIIGANVGTNGSGYVEAQLNAAGTHWTLLSAGSQ